MIATKEAHILTVDDNPVNLFLINTIVKKILPDAQIYQAKSGTEALEIYNTNTLHLIFMDIKLPYLNGYEVIQLIRKAEQEERTPIIVVSANNSSDPQQAHLIDGYLEKPIKYDALESILAEIL